MPSTPDSPQSEPRDGPRYATLLEQMQAWYRAQLATHPKPPTLERRVPHAQEQAP